MLVGQVLARLEEGPFLTDFSHFPGFRFGEKWGLSNRFLPDLKWIAIIISVSRNSIM